MEKDPPIIVVKEFNIEKNTVKEGFPPENSIAEGLGSCADLNQMADLYAELHPGKEEEHYLGEEGVIDYSLPPDTTS